MGREAITAALCWFTIGGALALNKFIDNESAESVPQLYRNLGSSRVYASGNPYGAHSIQIPLIAAPKAAASRDVPVKVPGFSFQNMNAHLKDSYGNRFVESKQLSQAVPFKPFPQQYVPLQELPAHFAQPIAAPSFAGYKQATPQIIVGSHYRFPLQTIQSSPINQPFSFPQGVYAGNIKSLAPQQISHTQFPGPTIQLPILGQYGQLPGQSFHYGSKVIHDRPVSPSPSPTAQQQPPSNDAIYANTQSKDHYHNDDSKFQRLPEAPHFQRLQEESQEESSEEELSEPAHQIVQHKEEQKVPVRETTVTSYMNGKKTRVNIKTKPPLPLLDISLLEPLHFDNPLVPQVQHFLPKISEATYHKLHEYTNDGKQHNKPVQKTKSYDSGISKAKPKKHSPKKKQQRYPQVEVHNVYYDEIPSASTIRPVVTVKGTPNESPEFSYEINSPNYKETYKEKAIKYNTETQSEPVHYSYGSQKHEEPVHYSYSHSSKEPVQIKEVRYEGKGEGPKHLIHKFNSDDNKEEKNRESEDSGDSSDGPRHHNEHRDHNEHHENHNHHEKPNHHNEKTNHHHESQHNHHHDKPHHHHENLKQHHEKSNYHENQNHHHEKPNNHQESHHEHHEKPNHHQENNNQHHGKHRHHDSQNHHESPKHHLQKPEHREEVNHHKPDSESHKQQDDSFQPIQYYTKTSAGSFAPISEYEEEIRIAAPIKVNPSQHLQPQSEPRHQSPSPAPQQQSHSLGSHHSEPHHDPEPHHNSAPQKHYTPVEHVQEKTKSIIIQEETPEHSEDDDRTEEMFIKDEDSEKDFEKAYDNAAVGFPAYGKSTDLEKDIYNPETYGVSRDSTDYDFKNSPFQQYYDQSDDYPKSSRLSYKDSKDKMKEDYFLDYSISKPESLTDHYKKKTDYYKLYKQQKPEKYIAFLEEDQKKQKTNEKYTSIPYSFYPSQDDQKKQKSSEKYTSVPYSFYPSQDQKKQKSNEKYTAVPYSFYPTTNLNNMKQFFAQYKAAPLVKEFDYSKGLPRDSSAYPSQPYHRYKSNTFFVEPQFQYGFEPLSLPRLLDSELATMASNHSPESEKPGLRKKIYKENFYIKKTSMSEGAPSS